MFGSPKKPNSNESSKQGVIGPDGRRINVQGSDRRVRLKRTDAEIKILGSYLSGDAPEEEASAILPGRVILNEFSDAGVGVYTTERLRMGQEVALTIDEPRRFYITGRIVFCVEVRSDSKIMQQIHFPWRVGVEFIYRSDAERSEVAAYCDELRKSWLGALVPSVVPGPPKVAGAPGKTAGDAAAATPAATASVTASATASATASVTTEAPAGSAPDETTEGTKEAA
jgi:hypothetical protein